MAAPSDDLGGHLWDKDHEVVTGDGARIRYTVRGVPDGPWLVLAAGFLCPDNFWMYVGPRLMERHRVIVMNYRAVGASTPPRAREGDDRELEPADFTIDRIAGDVAAVLEAEDASDVTVLGHSMGVQVALQLWRQEAERIAALVLVTGTYASPLATFYGSKLGTRLFPVAYHGIPLLPAAARRRLLDLARLPFRMQLARGIRALGPHTPAEAMAPWFEHLANVDPLIGLKIARGMHDFDAEPWLGDIDVPTLVVVGTADTFAPPQVGRFMVDRIPDAELVSVHEGTHAALIEFPDVIHDAIAEFLDRRLDLGPPAAGQ